MTNKKGKEQKLEQAAKQILLTKESAQRFLQNAGIMTKDGKLNSRYK